jgi:uncharacterized protein (DUF111 family)
MTGEEIGFLVQQLRSAGALEAWTAAVQMKKDRPGTIVSALCAAQRREALERVFFEHSTTLGVRRTTWDRTVCERETFAVDVLGHSVRVQRRTRPGAASTDDRDLAAEYDDLAKLAVARSMTLREAERLALEAARASAR